MRSPDPPLSAPAFVDAHLRERGSAIVGATDLAAVLHEPGLSAATLSTTSSSWNDLPEDEHLKDGGRYRRRRHASFIVDAGGVRRVPHRAHWQPSSYNALHGGLIRWFAPMTDAVVEDPAFVAVLRGMGRLCDRLRGERPWFVEAHQFRIDTTDGIGRPTPEGAHRDGVDVVAVIVVDRQHVVGGETRVFEQTGTSGVRFTLRDPWTALILDDERVVHETTAIQPDGEGGWRDTLVLTFRRDGFQDPPPA